MAKNETIYEYDPIKLSKDGKEAEKVIWSTHSLDVAVDAMKKGLPLKANPFIGKNTKLLKPNLVYRRTKEEIEDYIRCKQDPVFFAEKCYLMTPEGLQRCKMRDYQVDYLHHLQNHRFSILLSCRQAGKSVTTAIYALWTILFNIDKTGLVLSKSGPAGRDLIKKIKDMFLFLPYHLKCGVMKWNQAEISFDNNSSISTEAFSDTAGLGKTINFLILDEFAWCPPNDVELFYNNIIPTVTTISDSNVCIMSTQNGFNLFYKLWKAAIEHKNIYAPFKVDWYQVPQYNKQTKQWEKRTEEWKKMMIGVLGSEEAFYYQYGTNFSASDRCIVSRESLAKIRDRVVLFEPVTQEQLEEANIGLTLQHLEYLYLLPGYDIRNFYDGQHYYIVLIDLAEGSGGDYTVFNIFEVTIDADKIIYSQVGYWRSNKVGLDDAALEFWLLASQWFNGENSLISIEWNTYGALFYQKISQLNEPEYMGNQSWRFNVNTIGIELTNIVRYKRETIEQQVAGKHKHSTSFIPGIKFTSSNKPAACTLLKIMFERESAIINDIVTCGELESFEDKNGNGTYKASYGHDDIIMTFCQLPMLEQTVRFKNWIEDIRAFMNAKINNFTNHNQGALYDERAEFFDSSENIYNFYNQQTHEFTPPINKEPGNNIYNF